MGTPASASMLPPDEPHSARIGLIDEAPSPSGTGRLGQQGTTRGLGVPDWVCQVPEARGPCPVGLSVSTYPRAQQTEILRRAARLPGQAPRGPGSTPLQRCSRPCRATAFRSCRTRPAPCWGSTHSATLRAQVEAQRGGRGPASRTDCHLAVSGPPGQEGSAPCRFRSDPRPTAVMRRAQPRTHRPSCRRRCPRQRSGSRT